MGPRDKTTDAGESTEWRQMQGSLLSGVDPMGIDYIIENAARLTAVICVSWWPLCRWPHPGVSYPLALLAALPLAAVGVAHEIIRATVPV